MAEDIAELRRRTALYGEGREFGGEGALRRAFTVLYLGAAAYQALLNVKDKALREQLRGHFNGVPYPCLVDVKSRFYPAHTPDLSDFRSGFPYR